MKESLAMINDFKKKVHGFQQFFKFVVTCDSELSLEGMSSYQTIAFAPTSSLAFDL